MSRSAGEAILVAITAVLAGCPRTAPDPVSAYDLPVKTSGGIEETHIRPAVPLTLTVESVDPPDDAELASAVEDSVAFSQYSTLSDCESAQGWETGFQAGTIAIGFVLTPAGTTQDVALVLTTGGPSESFASCLIHAVESMILADVALEEPASFHMVLKYGQ